MHITHAIVGHAVLSLTMLSALGALFLAIFRLDRKPATGRHFGTPLDPRLVAGLSSGGTSASRTPER
jgi:hypothetical protein